MTFSCSLKVKILLNYYGIYYVMFFCQLHIFAKLFIIDINWKFCLCKCMFAPKRITLILKSSIKCKRTQLSFERYWIEPGKNLII